MLKRIFNRTRATPRLNEKLSYEDARDALATQAEALHRELAQRNDAPAEILYYLADSPSTQIRTLVAANPATPHKANLRLCDDGTGEVRAELALKIARLLPTLDPSEQAKLREGAIEVMNRLANDQLPRVRQILAEEIKHSADVPREVVRKLAFDMESVIAVPIVEYSPLLSDDDLLELIAMSKVEGILQAVAKRPQVSETVADAVVANLDVSAVAALLVNPNAQIREQALDAIIENAAQVEAWHRPLVVRTDLSQRAIRRVASFVASALIDELCERHNLDDDTTRALKGKVRTRVDHEQVSPDYAVEVATAEADIREAADKGGLDDAFVEAAAERGQREHVTQALAQLTGLSSGLIKRIFVSRNGKAITALVWKAGLSMRTALVVQTRVATVPRQSLLLARDGVHYPLTPQEMDWHLEYFKGQS